MVLYLAGLQGIPYHSIDFLSIVVLRRIFTGHGMVVGVVTPLSYPAALKVTVGSSETAI